MCLKTYNILNFILTNELFHRHLWFFKNLLEKLYSNRVCQVFFRLDSFGDV